MTDTDMLRLEVDRALAKLGFLETIVSNIAKGAWNVGRAEPITVEQYAAGAMEIYKP